LFNTRVGDLCTHEVELLQRRQPLQAQGPRP
jgi:hypothetical protein